jgi:hypothetical protein
MLPLQISLDLSVTVKRNKCCPYIHFLVYQSQSRESNVATKIYLDLSVTVKRIKCCRYTYVLICQSQWRESNGATLHMSWSVSHSEENKMLPLYMSWSVSHSEENQMLPLYICLDLSVTVKKIKCCHYIYILIYQLSPSHETRTTAPSISCSIIHHHHHHHHHHTKYVLPLQIFIGLSVRF